MRHQDRARRGALLASAAASVCFLGIAPGTPALAQSGPVPATPAAGTPTLAPNGTTEQVRQLVQCGGTMYAVGTFTSISGWNGTATSTVTRTNVFSFSATAPFTLTSWAPAVNGTVNSIAFNNGNCADAYIGGQFTSVNGATMTHLAEIDTTTTGGVVARFGGHVGGGYVNTLLAVNGHLLAGGTFTTVNGNKGANPYYASLNPVTGADDGFLHLGISGHYVFHGVKNNSTQVYNQQLSHGGTLLLVEGDFTSVGGLGRQQIFMLDVSGPAATVTGWSSPEFDGSLGQAPGGYYYQCGDSHPFYIQAAAWSPDDSEIYLADTGYKAWNWTGVYPLVGLCDAVAAFPATQAEVTHSWVNYDGCNSLYSVAADDSAVYIGGHERWANDPNGCKKTAPGYINAPGLGGFTPGPSGGTLLLNPAGNAGRYSRSRGRGADDMLLTDAGLWVASDNFGGDTSCDGKAGFSGICFLPYS